MKKIILAMLLLAMACAFSACGKPSVEEEPSTAVSLDWRIEVEGIEGWMFFTREDAAYIQHIENPLYTGIRLIDALKWMRPAILAQSNAWTVTATGADGANIEYSHAEVHDAILAWGIRGELVPPCMSSNGVAVDVYDVVKITLNG